MMRSLGATAALIGALGTVTPTFAGTEIKPKLPPIVTAWAEITGCDEVSTYENAVQVITSSRQNARLFHLAMIDNIKNGGRIRCRAFDEHQKLDVVLDVDSELVCVTSHDPVDRMGSREAMCYWINKGVTVEGDEMLNAGQNTTKP